MGTLLHRLRSFSRSYQYNSLHQITKTTAQDLSYWDYNYDSLGQLTTGKRYWSDQDPVAGQHFTYTFDDIGNRTATTRGGDNNGQNLRSATYTPNYLNQYGSRTVPAAADVVGTANAVATITVDGQTAARHGTYYHKEVTLSADTAKNIQITSDLDNETNEGKLFAPTSPESYAYDNDGNMLQDGRWNYTWDAENRLTKMVKRHPITDPETPKIEFEYDFAGRRISKKIYDDVNGTTPVETIGFIYDGWTIVATTAGGTSLDLAYVYGSELSGVVQGAAGIGGLLMIQDTATGDTWNVANNHRGDVVGLINASTGNVDARYEYGPFGEAIRVEGEDIAFKNHIRFSSKWHDAESGLSYYGFRYYNPETGRWLSRDPLGEYGGLNLFAFGYNGPINGFDDLGGQWSVHPGMPGTGFGSPFADRNIVYEAADQVDDWVVTIVTCCENNILGSGIGNELAEHALTGTYLLQDCAHEVIDVSRLGQSVEEQGLSLSSAGEEVDRALTVAGGAVGGLVAKAGWKIGRKFCKSVCDRVSIIVRNAKNREEAINRALKSDSSAGGEFLDDALRMSEAPGLPKKIHEGAQGKHLANHNNFQPGRSTLNTGINPQELLNGIHSGKYLIIRNTPRGQPVVDFGKNIGSFNGSQTQYGIVHFGGKGAHIVPANPIQH